MRNVSAFKGLAFKHMKISQSQNKLSTLKCLCICFLGLKDNGDPVSFSPAPSSHLFNKYLLRQILLSACECQALITKIVPSSK